MPPLLILIFATFKDDAGKTLTVPAYGISFPGDPSGSKRPEKTVAYTINKIAAQNNEFADNLDVNETEEDVE